jgi:hypothetical protein
MLFVLCIVSREEGVKVSNVFVTVFNTNENPVLLNVHDETNFVILLEDVFLAQTTKKLVNSIFVEGRFFRIVEIAKKL